MALNPLLNIDLDYFTNIKNLGDTPAAKIKAVYLDNQFNIVGDYINDEVIPLLDQLVTNSLPGTDVLGTANKFWINVGDTTTEWGRIGNDNIADGGLLWQKLVTAATGSVLAANSAGVFTSVAPTAANQVLVSRAGELPVWRLINASDITDRSIDSSKIALGTLTSELFQDGLLTPQLYDGVVTTPKLANKTVTTAKVANGALTKEKMEINDYTSFANGAFTFKNTMPNGFVNDISMFAANVFTENIDGPSRIMDYNSITTNKLQGVIIDKRSSIADNVVTPDKIAAGVVQGSFIQNILQTTVTADNALGTNLIQAQHLPANYRAVLGV